MSTYRRAERLSHGGMLVIPSWECSSDVRSTYAQSNGRKGGNDMVGYQLPYGGSSTRPAAISEYTSVWGRAEGERSLLITHGDSDGHLCFESPEDEAYFKGTLPWALICCCYPAAVKSRHPDYHVVGDWEGVSYVYWGDASGHRLHWEDVKVVENLWIWVSQEPGVFQECQKS